jgi:hypothetical protein
MSAFVPIGHTVTIPAVNTEPTMASGAVVTLTDAGNILELEGETDGTGTNKVYVLRKRILDDGTFRYVPFAPDKPMVGETVGAGVKRFWDRLVLGEVGAGEKVCLFNPTGGPVLTNCNVRLVRA